MNNHTLEMNDQEIERLCQLLNRRLGFNYTAQKKYLVQSRLEKRLKELNLPNYQEYVNLLEYDQLELNRFFSLLTTNVTSFFRESSQFRVLQENLLGIVKQNCGPVKKVRCWSAGCSSGEEAYTLAIVLNESLGPEWDIKVLASDISTRKLEEGMAAIYYEEKLNEVPLAIRQKYFQAEPAMPGYYRVSPRLRSQIVFKKINLVEIIGIPSHIKFDIIFCRNVFIYLSKESQVKVVQSFYNYLKEAGFLFLGHSESLSYSDARWQPLKGSIYQKKPVPNL